MFSQACLLLLLLNICFSAGKKSTNPDIPSDADWGSIESIDTTGGTKQKQIITDITSITNITWVFATFSPWTLVQA